jgi:hypothetical protein
VLWWVRKGHRPAIQEAVARLELLRAHGPAPDAFTFRQSYPAPDAPASTPTRTWGGDECPAT